MADEKQPGVRPADDLADEVATERLKDWSDKQTAPHNGGAQTAELPVRVCPNCSTQERTAGQFCPHCGASYVKRAARFSRRKKLIGLVILLALVIAGGVTGVVLKVRHDNTVADQKRAADAQQQQAAQQAKDQKATQDAKNSLQQGVHTDLVNQLQAAVMKDAQKDVDSGTLNGPNITKADCTPSDGSSVTDVSVHNANFSCIAVNQTGSGGNEQGYRFSATVNYDSGNLSWHLGG